MRTTNPVRTARTLSGLSRSQMAAMAGVSPSTILRIERGEVDPTTGMLARILAAAGFAQDTDLTVVSDPTAVAAARSVLDPVSGLGSFPGVDRWVERWSTAGFVTRGHGGVEARSGIELAERAGLSARLASRPGIRSFRRDRPWVDLAAGLRGSGADWAATGSAAANRLLPSADAPWPVFYVDDPLVCAGRLGLAGPEPGSVLSLLPFDGVAEVGVTVDDDGFRWVDPLQVVIDCFGGTDRMPDQAEVVAGLLGTNMLGTNLAARDA